MPNQFFFYVFFKDSKKKSKQCWSSTMNGWILNEWNEFFPYSFLYDHFLSLSLSRFLARAIQINDSIGFHYIEHWRVSSLSFVVRSKKKKTSLIIIVYRLNIETIGQERRKSKKKKHIDYDHTVKNGMTL